MKHIEYSNKFQFNVSLPKGVYSKDDCGKLKSKESNHIRRSKQNTYHAVNKNIASSKFTDKQRRKRGCPGSLGSCHFLFHVHQILTQNFWYCCELILYLYWCNIYCIPTFPWLIPPDTAHRFIKISK